MKGKIEEFSIHNDREQSVLLRDLSKWRDSTDPENDVFGPVVCYSWIVDGNKYERCNKSNFFSLRELPDASGFICFEAPSVPNNCLLLDAYGQERMRLTVPWELTRSHNSESAKPPTAFVRVSAPVNPADGKEGRLGVEAWVEYAGYYYFELNYLSGQFLWGKEIRD